MMSNPAQPPIHDDTNQPSGQQTSSLSNQQKLEIWEQSVMQAARIAPQAVPLALDQATDTLNPNQVHSVASAKENIQVVGTPDQTNADLGAMVQMTEHEKVPEIPVEVESFIQRVENLQDMAPREVVIADGTNESATPNYPSRPVVVLPISKSTAKKGAWKTPTWSIRWLVEWSGKIIKMFAGKVVYRD